MSRSFVRSNNDNLVGTLASAIALPVTIACWIKPSNTTDLQTVAAILDPGVDNRSQVVLQVNGVGATDQVRAAHFASGGSTGVAAGATNYTAGAWQHVAGTFVSNSARQVWLGGTQDGSNSAGLGGVASANRISVGRTQDTAPNDAYDGLIAHVAAWSIALSSGEIASLAAGANPLAVQAGSLIGYWPLTGNASPEPDAVASADLAVVGASYSSDDPTVDAPPGGSASIPAIYYALNRRR